MNDPPAHAVAARRIGSPIGALVLFASGDGLAGLSFGHRVEAAEVRAADARNPHLDAAEAQLEEYFARARTRFELVLDVRGTPFQRAVWSELSRIPFGTTRSYRRIAERIGRPASVRAVGAASGANPLAVIVPCHRVLGADGSLTGFGGGLELKKKLLVFEGVLLDVG